MGLGSGIVRGLAGAIALGMAATQPVQAQTASYEATFDSVLGSETRAPRTFEAVYQSGFERQVAPRAAT